MVSWKLLGEQMPRTAKEWETEFKRYQEYPEFKMYVLIIKIVWIKNESVAKPCTVLILLNNFLYINNRFRL